MHAQLVFYFHISINFLILGLFKGCKKGDFRWFGRALGVLINHRKRFISSARRSIWNSKQPPKRFDREKRKLVLSHEPCVKTPKWWKIQPPISRMGKHDDHSWFQNERFQISAHFLQHVISKSLQINDTQSWSHGITSISAKDRVIMDRLCIQFGNPHCHTEPEDRWEYFQKRAIRNQIVIAKSLRSLGWLECGLQLPAGSSNRTIRCVLSGRL